MSLRLAYPAASWVPLAVQALQACLGRAGIDIQLMPYTPDDLYGRFLSNPENALRGEWDLAYTNAGPDWFGDNNARSLFVPLFDSRNFGAATTNYGGYLNRAVDTLIDRAVTSRSQALAEEAWSDAARLIMSDVAIVPLIERKAAYARSRRVRNCTWDASGLNCDLTALWLADATTKPGDSR
jgi:peptide/nickel transport system substrate-binding protein